MDRVRGGESMGKNEIVCFEYRNCIWMPGRTEYIFLSVRNDDVRVLEPLWRRRSRTGAHGEDCYTLSYLKDADVEVRIEISNSGRHYCGLTIRRQLDTTSLLRVAMWLHRNEHLCESIAADLIRAGLPPKFLHDIIQGKC